LIYFARKYFYNRPDACIAAWFADDDVKFKDESAKDLNHLFQENSDKDLPIDFKSLALEDKRLLLAPQWLSKCYLKEPFKYADNLNKNADVLFSSDVVVSVGGNP
jgi:hypothetical protein